MFLLQVCSWAGGVSQNVDPESDVATKKRKIEERDGDYALTTPKKDLETTNASHGMHSR